VPAANTLKLAVFPFRDCLALRRRADQWRHISGDGIGERISFRARDVDGEDFVSREARASTDPMSSILPLPETIDRIG
jgi:hypothetical protein